VSRYRLSRPAADDIVRLYLEGLDMFGPHQAQSYHDQLERAFDLIARYPEAGRLRETVAATVRIMPFQAHIIVYRPDPIDHVRILRIRHAAENWIDDPLGDPS
jgi:toxin ParE1/3/4